MTLRAKAQKYIYLKTVLDFYKNMWYTTLVRNRFYRTQNKVTLIGDLAEPCTCNPLQQGLTPDLRILQGWQPHGFAVLRCGSCAIAPREPCQVGNQAALSGAR